MTRFKTRRRGWRLTEAPPERATPLRVRDGIRRIVAANPGPMTYHGTNCWLVDWAGGTLVMDPGSEDPRHLDAILAEAGPGLSHILLTHTHHDHLAGAETLSRRGGVPIVGFHASADPDFQPTIGLHEGDSICGLTALHTPGHAMDHLCFATDDGVLFSGDHVMGWSTSVVPPSPRGDLARFVAQLERVRDRDDRLMLSAHGPAIEHPRELVQSLLDHRAAREAMVTAALGPTPLAFDSVFSRAYINLRPELQQAARANLLSHLEKLETEGRAALSDAGWRSIG